MRRVLNGQLENLRVYNIREYMQESPRKQTESKIASAREKLGGNGFSQLLDVHMAKYKTL